MRARNDCETDDEALTMQDTINDELKFTLMQREKRKDLEILRTPQIYINQNSSSIEVQEWLRCKGFSDIIIKKLCGLTGDELFALSPHVIEGYFGQKESRRLISQIVLQKNICDVRKHTFFVLNWLNLFVVLFSSTKRCVLLNFLQN